MGQYTAWEIIVILIMLAILVRVGGPRAQRRKRPPAGDGSRRDPERPASD
jgi:hypothetical protein